MSRFESKTRSKKLIIPHQPEQNHKNGITKQRPLYLTQIKKRSGEIVGKSTRGSRVQSNLLTDHTSEKMFYHPSIQPTIKYDNLAPSFIAWFNHEGKCEEAGWLVFVVHMSRNITLWVYCFSLTFARYQIIDHLHIRVRGTPNLFVKKEWHRNTTDLIVLMAWHALIFQA